MGIRPQIRESYQKQLTQNHTYMKKKYLMPEVEVSLLRIESSFLASADNLTKDSAYADGYTEDEFWD